MKLSRSICGFAVAVVLFAGSVAGQKENPIWHKVAGIVVDEGDQPVEGARVCGRGTLAGANRVPCGQSDVNGQFFMTIDRPDTYTIYAEQQQKGYPSTILSFYGKAWRNLPHVTIGEMTKLVSVKVKLGPVAGRLVLDMKDDATGKPIESGVIEVCRLAEPGSWWSFGIASPNGHYEMLTPEVPFTIKFQIWQKGWVNRKAFDETGRPVELVQVDLGARKNLSLRLK